MRSLTVADKDRGRKLRALGCIVCLNEHECYTEPAIHHIDGKTKEGCHQLTLPLCPKHHQYKDNEKPQRWVSLHGDGRYNFENTYGTQQELLEQVNGLINV